MNPSFLIASFNAVSFSAGNYWNVSTALSGVLLYFDCKQTSPYFMQKMKGPAKGTKEKTNKEDLSFSLEIL